jgi:hypothetical protein
VQGSGIPQLIAATDSRNKSIREQLLSFRVAATMKVLKTCCENPLTDKKKVTATTVKTLASVSNA